MIYCRKFKKTNSPTEKMKKQTCYQLLLLAFMLLTAHSASAQDIIVKSNNDSIRAKVIEFDAESIYFRYANEREGIVQKIHKNQVKQIIYENGSKLTIVYNPYEISSDMMIKERFHAFKVDVFSALLNHYTIGYEIRLRLGLNLEVKGALIGTNLNTSLKHSEGFFVKGGLKFVKWGTSMMKGLTYIQPLKGSYYKPEFIFGKFKRDENHREISYTNYAFNLVFGRQNVINNFFVVDYFGAIGYAYQQYSYRKDSVEIKTIGDFTYGYSHVFFGKKIPITISGGVLIGFAH